MSKIEEIRKDMQNRYPQRCLIFTAYDTQKENNDLKKKFAIAFKALSELDENGTGNGWADSVVETAISYIEVEE